MITFVATNSTSSANVSNANLNLYDIQEATLFPSAVASGAGTCNTLQCIGLGPCYLGGLICSEGCAPHGNRYMHCMYAGVADCEFRSCFPL